MKIAVVGTGIAGNVAAAELHRIHDVTVFEAADRVGGHAHTVTVDAAPGPLAIDMGFIVYNDERYPAFSALLRRLGVATQRSDMSFSVRVEPSNLEYSSRHLLRERRNLLSPSFWRMLCEAGRFDALGLKRLREAPLDLTLGAFLRGQRYAPEFVDQLLVPMAASIWSSSAADVEAMPARFFGQFFTNHRFLDMVGQPVWRTVTGGSRSYVDALTRGFRDRIRTSSPVRSIRRTERWVEVVSASHGTERFDHVVIAAHADEALAMLADPSEDERRTLGAFRFQSNEAVLHTDTRLLPRSRAAWASWNAHVSPERSDRVAVSYWMNLLQDLPTQTPYIVTLNETASIDPRKVLRIESYRHPVFSVDAVRAQARHASISGPRRTHFAGAYWGYGFHEDGAVSGVAVAKQLLERGRSELSLVAEERAP